MIFGNIFQYFGIVSLNFKNSIYFFCINSVLALLSKISLNYKQNENKIEATMIHTKLKLKIILFVIISLSFGVLLPGATLYSQNYSRIYEDIGGGGGGSSSQTDNSDNSTIYIVGGVVIAGIIAYYFLTRNKKKDKEEADTSSALNNFNTPEFASEFDDFEHEVAKAKDDFPVDFMIGIRNNKAFISDKTYLMGVAVRF